MKTHLPLRVLLALSLQLSALCFFTGCASTGTTAKLSPAEVQQRRALAVEFTLSNALAPVLRNNPDYIPVAREAADRLATLQRDTITTVDIANFIAGTALKPEDVPQVTAAVNGAWLIYSLVSPDSAGSVDSQVNATVARADVQAFLAAISRGLRTAAANAAANPKPPAALSLTRAEARLFARAADDLTPAEYARLAADASLLRRMAGVQL